MIELLVDMISRPNFEDGGRSFTHRVIQRDQREGGVAQAGHYQEEGVRFLSPHAGSSGGAGSPLMTLSGRSVVVKRRDWRVAVGGVDGQSKDEKWGKERSK